MDDEGEWTKEGTEKNDVESNMIFRMRKHAGACFLSIHRYMRKYREDDMYTVSYRQCPEYQTPTLRDCGISAGNYTTAHNPQTRSRFETINCSPEFPWSEVEECGYNTLPQSAVYS
jgi:hypothetical protein